MSIFLRSSMCFRVPHLCSKIPKINNWSMDSGAHSVCFRGDFAIKTVVGFLRWHTFKHLIHMQYFLLPTNLVIVFVHWVSTGVLYKPRQYSLFWDYIPESKLCFCLNLCRPPGTYSIRPIQKLLNSVNNVTTRGARGATPGIHPDEQKQRYGSDFAK